MILNGGDQVLLPSMQVHQGIFKSIFVSYLNELFTLHQLIIKLLEFSNPFLIETLLTIWYMLESWIWTDAT